MGDSLYGLKNGKPPADMIQEEAHRASEIAQGWLSAFQTACSEYVNSEDADTSALLSLFLPEGFWRDRLCLSWDFHTAEGHPQIRSLIERQGALRKAGIKECSIDAQSDLGGPAFQPWPYPAEIGTVVEFTFRFELTTPPASGKALVRLAKDDKDSENWKAYILLTQLEEFKEHEIDHCRPLGHYQGHTRTWDEQYASRVQETVDDPTAVIVGGGSSGLMTAAWFVKLGIKTLVVERNEEIGDNWRNRYDILTLHTPYRHCTFALQAYPENTPEWIPRTKLADFIQYYAKTQEIPIWTSSQLVPGPTYDSSTGIWTVTIDRGGERVTLHPRHLILATGASGDPKIPEFKGAELFRGEFLHTSAFQNSKGWKDKRVVIIGMGVSGTDIALEAETNGAKVLIMQRSPKVLSALSTVKPGFDKNWPADRSIPASDFLFAALPFNLLMRMLKDVVHPIQKEADSELHARVKEKGFLVGWGEEIGRGPVGHTGLVYEKLGGFCVDIGCFQRIIEDKIKVKSGVQVQEIDEAGVVFSDGSRADADIIILATGYHRMRHTATRLLGEGLATTDIWGLDEEGELKGVFRETGQPGLWYAAGGFQDVRYNSKFLALRVQGEESGLVHR